MFKEIMEENFPNLMKTINSDMRSSAKHKHKKYEYNYTKAHNKNAQSNERKILKVMGRCTLHTEEKDVEIV